jgi:N-glycosylase/DNA lyase
MMQMALMTAHEPAPVRAAVRRCECCAPTPWGEEWQLGTAAFWVQQAAEFPAGVGRHRLGASLREEVAVCMLGGYGVPGPVGNAAFVALRDAGMLAEGLTEDAMAEGMTTVLARQLDVSGRKTRYRFHQQRPRRLAAALAGLAAWESEAPELEDLALRDRLMMLPGVGPKTASWVVRNHRDSDAVAIVDIHVQRAGVTAGVFCAGWALPRHYDRFESAFLDWASLASVSAADLDAAIWRLLSTLARHRGRIAARRFAAIEAVDEALFVL